MKRKFHLQTVGLAVALFCQAQSASAIKIVVPEQYKAQVESAKAAEQAERARELGGTQKAEAGEIEIADQSGPAASAEKPAPAADAFVMQSVVEAESTAAAFEGTLAADEGLVSGQVLDKESGAPVAGTAIIIEGTDVATVTAEDGRYSLGPVSAGQYTISFVKTGYIEANVTEYQIAGGEISVFPFALPPRPAEMSDEVYELQDFSVTAEQATEMMLKLDIRMNTDGVMDMLTTEDFSKFAAGDAAEALSKTSGASLSEGKYAVIRGLNDRYNTTEINGVVLPSPDPDRKAIALDIFPTSLFDSLVVRKSFSADMPGEASGGSIQLNTKAVPEEGFFDISVGVSLQEDARNDFLSDPDRTSYTDWLLGFGDEDNRGFTEDGSSKAPNTLGGANFPFFAAQRRDAPIDRNLSFSFGNTHAASDKWDIGYLFGLKTSSKIRSKSTEREENIVNNSGQIEANERGFQETGTESFDLGVLASVEAHYDDAHILRYIFLLSETSETSSSVEAFTGNTLDKSIGDSIFVRGELALEEKTLEAHQFEGSHDLSFFDSIFDDGASTLSWYYTAADMEQAEPDVRGFENWKVTNESQPGLLDADRNPIGVPAGILNPANGVADENADIPAVRFNRETNQTSDLFGFKFESGKITWKGNIEWSFDLGLDAERSDRDFTQLEWVRVDNRFTEPLAIAAPRTQAVEGQSFFEDIAAAIAAQESFLQGGIADLNNEIISKQNERQGLENNLVNAENTLQSRQDNLQNLIDNFGADDPTSPLHPFFLTQQEQVANAQASVNGIETDIAAVNTEIGTIQSQIPAIQAAINSITPDTRAFADPSGGNTLFLVDSDFGFGFVTDPVQKVFRPSGIITTKATGGNDVTGLFIQQKIKASFLTIDFGLRMEKTELNFDQVPGFEAKISAAPLTGLQFDSIETIDQTDYLPFLAMTADVVEDVFRIRTSFSKTVAKPTFREIAPFPILNLADKAVEIGNAGFISTGSGQPLFASRNVADPEALAREFSGLAISDVTNFDLRFEWFLPNDGFLAVGAFAKTIENPIERAEVNTISGVEISSFVNNNNDATIQGMEFELSQNLGFLGSGWEPFTIGGNYTVIDAEVNRSDLELANFSVLDGVIDRGAFESRTLFDQPDYIANAFVTMDVVQTGTTITLSANAVGEQLHRVGRPGGSAGAGSLDLIWEDFLTVNLVVQQRINDTWKLTFAAENINTPERELVEDPSLFGQIPDIGSGNSEAQFSQTGGVRQKFEIKPSFSLSISASF